MEPKAWNATLRLTPANAVADTKGAKHGESVACSVDTSVPLHVASVP